MDWDYSYFIPENNPFRKQRISSQHDDAATLIVTDVNGHLHCALCQRSVCDVGSIFYEIEKKYYCANCGSKLAVNGKGVNGTLRAGEEIFASSKV